MSQLKFGNRGGKGSLRPAAVVSFEELEEEERRAKQKAADKKVVREFLQRMPVTERLAMVHSEFNWYLGKEHNPAAHEKCLPEYCYHIFEKMRQVTFKALPKFDPVVTGDLEALKACKSVEEAKKVIGVDFERIGIVLGIGLRGKRFVEMEAQAALKREGVWGLVPKNGPADLALVFDKSRLEQMAKDGGVQDVGRGLEQILQETTGPHIEKIPGMIEYMVKLAYAWGSRALADLSKGMEIGLNKFLDDQGKLVEEPLRENIYEFLLQAWPEIKAMLEANPRKTITDLHQWMQPFMRQDMCNRVDLDYLRNVCGPLPKGIGLKLRPLSLRSHR
jgi:hypothetical protein